MQGREPSIPKTQVAGFYRILLDALPSPVLVVEEDVRIVSFNAAAATILTGDPEQIHSRRVGEALQCLHAAESPAGCGRAPCCRHCVLRKSATESLQGQKVLRRKLKLDLGVEGARKKAFYLVTTAPFDYRKRRLVLIVLEDINEIVALRRILPICASCKKIRDDRDYWQTLESYFAADLAIDFTHGLCPECIEKLYPDFAAD